MKARDQWVAFMTIVTKEIRRFTRIWPQTLLPPAITMTLYFVIFGNLIGSRIGDMGGFDYMQYIVPGLIMMSVIQNAFANTSSSITQSKIMGNLVFMLMSPLSSLEIFGAFVAAAILRATIVATALYAVGWLFCPLPLAQPLAVLGMLLLSAGCLAVFGMIGGIVARKFDHIAAFQNFFIMPFSFLSGVFYSIHTLPPFWASASHFNPFFYMIDGFRYGFYGTSDAHIGLSVAVVGGFFVLLSAIALGMLRSGYQLRS